MKTRIYIICVALLAAVHTVSLAQAPATGVRARWTPDTLHLSFALSEPRPAQGSNYAVWAMPRIGGVGGDTLTLAKAVFRGRRNMHYVERERHFAAPAVSRMARRLTSAPRSTVQRAKNEVMLGDTVRYDLAIARTAANNWLWRDALTIDVCREKDGCCSVATLPTQTIGRARYVPPFVPSLAPVQDNTGRAGQLQKSNPVLHHISEYRPYTKDRILRHESGALYVHFELDKTALRHDFRGNGPILDRIVDITRQIMADSTSMVKKIQIIGLASVEGAVKHNEWLAGERANALKRYVQQRVPTPDSLYDVANGGEAWTELRSQIEDSQFEGRDELLRIIDTESDVAVRERKMKALRGGRPYAYLREKVLADQRNSGYLRIFYDYVPDTAAATINRATSLIGNARYAAALQLLQTVKADRRAQNALGVALYMTGQKQQAIECFRRAAKDGNREAQDNLRQWEEIQKAQAE